MIERDAVMVAWERGLRLPRIDVTEEASQPDAPAMLRAAAALVGQASRAGVEVHVARIPTGVPGVFCAVGVAVAHGGDVPVAAVGGRAADDPSAGVLGAVREALQVCSFLRNVARALGRPDRAPARIRGEEDRAAFLVTRTGAELVLDWLRGFGSGELLPAATPVPTEDLVTGLVADGADPLVVDLTPRLPPSLVDMGWSVARVVPAGYQHLRMSEEFSWSWNLPRISGAEVRTGLPARFRPGEGHRPNPLP